MAAAEFVEHKIEYPWPVQPEGLSIVVNNGKFLMAYNTLGHSSVTFASSDDGVNFQTLWTTPNDGFGGSSIAFYKNRLFLAYIGSNNHLALVEVKLDANGNPFQIGAAFDSDQGSNDAPILYSTADGLFIAWLGAGDTKHLCVSRVTFPGLSPGFGSTIVRRKAKPSRKPAVSRK